MPIRTVQEILAAGRPPAGFALTHDYTVRTLAEARGVLPFGLLREGAVHREYAWRRQTGNVRLQTGAARQRFGDAPGKTIPAVLAVSLALLGGEEAGRFEGKGAAELIDSIGHLAYSDVALLCLERAIERSRGAVPLIDSLPCSVCDEPMGEMRLGRENVQVAQVDWRPEGPPRAVVWLDEPFRYGEKDVEALVVQAVTWAEMYGDAKADDLRNREWGTVRAATSAVVGYVSGGEFHPSPMARSVVAEKVLDADIERLATAAFGCSGGAQMGAIVEHRACGQMTLVPFVWQQGA